MKILNFGSCNIDYVYSLDHILKSGETQEADNMCIFPGGKGLNQSIAVAKAGSYIYHACCFGSDGKLLQDFLTENGVDISYAKTVDERNGHAMIQVDKEGANSICVYKGSNGAVSKNYIDDVLNYFSCGDIIVLQNEISNVDYLIKKAAEKGMIVIFNPSPISASIAKMDFKLITYLVLNEGEIKDISSCDEIGECLKILKIKYPKLKIVLTLGSDGCIYTDEKNNIYQPAFDVRVVDTTAAGDTFMGYFVDGISNAEKYEDILKIASAASALAVTTKGAAPSIPDKESVLNALENIKQHNIKEAHSSVIEKIMNFI